MLRINHQMLTLDSYKQNQMQNHTSLHNGNVCISFTTIEKYETAYDIFAFFCASTSFSAGYYLKPLNYNCVMSITSTAINL